MNWKKWKFLVRVLNRCQGSKVRRRGRGQKVRLGNARLLNTRIEIEGDRTWLEIGHGARLSDCHIVLRGQATQLVVGGETRLRHAWIVVEDGGSRITVGPQTTMTRAVLQSKEGGHIGIGRDCMVGHYAEIANSDSHSLIDAADGQRLNPPANVVLGDHVWVCARCWVTKGSRIGENTVIAAGSRVSGDLPRGVLAAGDPARIKRNGVTWDRRRLGNGG